MPDPYTQYELRKREWLPQMRRRSIPVPSNFNREYNTPMGFRMGEETRDELEYLPKISPDLYQDEFISNRIPEDYAPNLSLEEMQQLYPMIDYLNKLRLTKADIQDLLLTKNYNVLQSLLNNFDKNENIYDTDVLNLVPQPIEGSQLQDGNSEIPERFSLMYNTPDRFRAGWESKDYQSIGELPESRVYFDEDDDEQKHEYGSGELNVADDVIKELQHLQEKHGYQVNIPEYDNYPEIAGIAHKINQEGTVEKQSGVYTEGGVVYVPDSQIMGKTCCNKYIEHKFRFIIILGETKTNSESTETLVDDLNSILDRYSTEFKRPERLDVKKPGPPFDPQITTQKSSNGKLSSFSNREFAKGFLFRIFQSRQEKAARCSSESFARILRRRHRLRVRKI